MTITQPCAHGNYKTYFNIGYDIDENGEELQHLDLCKDCGMFCMWSILHFADGSEKKWVGEWEIDDGFLKFIEL